MLDLAKFRSLASHKEDEKRGVDIDKELYKIKENCSNIVELNNQITNMNVPVVPVSCGDDNYDMGF